ncbi:RNA polymerase II-associated protein spaghetti [Ptiloglossa arizonensis]|uniref:RNA polymerase II-associated protein spaghetti n=1 Tax=Ptiloglossa arizonensis TaxID=3350558 RepID=UPI003FA08FCF
MDKSILLQKQVKDNTADLQNEFLDMKNWEELMKNKDKELRTEMSGQITLPPIRSKSKSKTKVTLTKQNGSDIKSKRIKSFDYCAWDKFDAEEACNEIVDEEEQLDDFGDEVMSKEELKKAHKLATKYKNEGNIFVQQQKWTQAIGCYNLAIKTFKSDAVFYANRALCQIELECFFSAKSDCSIAIQLDETYEKAYYRRAIVGMNLKEYKEAKQDLEKVLKLNSSNNEAKLLLAKIENEIKASDLVTTSKESIKKSSDTSPVKKQMSKKIWSSIEPTTVITDIKDVKEGEKDTNEGMKKDQAHKNSKDLEPTKKDVVDIQDTTTEYKKRVPRIPVWLPEKDDVVVIEPIKRPPHLRSKKSLTRIPVEEVQFGITKYHDNNEKTAHKEYKPVQLEKISEDDNFKKNGFNKVSESLENINIPSIPKTAVQFVKNWKANKLSEFRYKYLKQLPKNSLPKIFQDSMESDIFSEILEVLRIEFIKRKEFIFSYLQDLSKVKRFRAFIMFISNSEKESLRILFEYCKAVENVSNEEVIALQQVYEI